MDATEFARVVAVSRGLVGFNHRWAVNLLEYCAAYG